MKWIKNNIDTILVIGGGVMMTPLLFDDIVPYKWIILFGACILCIGFAIGLTNWGDKK